MEDEKVDAEVTLKVQSWWKNWRRVYVVLCYMEMNVKTKWKVFMTMVRPALMCRTETPKKAHEKHLLVAEMRMLGWVFRVTKLDKIRNERIWCTTKVGEIANEAN